MGPAQFNAAALHATQRSVVLSVLQCSPWLFHNSVAGNVCPSLVGVNFEATPFFFSGFFITFSPHKTICCLLLFDVSLLWHCFLKTASDHCPQHLQALAHYCDKMPGHSHRASSLRQQNKKNKRSKSSKRSLSRAAGGKVNGRAHNQKAAFAQSKADRKNKLQQKREGKRAELLKMKRMQGILGPPPPRIIGIISLGTMDAIEEKIKSAILERSDRTERTLLENIDATVTAKFDVHKKEGSLTILTNSTAFRSHYSDLNDADAAVQSSLDLCRVCNMIVFAIDADGPRVNDILDMQIGGDDAASLKSSKSQRPDWDHLVSDRGDRILSAIKAQGMPSLLTVLAHTIYCEDQDADFMSVKSAKSVRRTKTKRSLNLKKYASRFATTEFGPNNDDVMEVNISHLYEKPADMEVADYCEPATKRGDVAALVRALCTKAATAPKWIAESPRPFILSDSHQYDQSKQELNICGFVRGRVPFSVDALVHVPGMGTFGCKSIQRTQAPFFRQGETMNTTTSTVLFSEPNTREPLDMFATPDALDGEQNLVGFDDDDDLDEGAEEDDNQNQRFARPAGWSDYQSAWLDAVDAVGADDAGFDHGELADELNKKSSSASVAHMDIDDANDISPEEKRLLQEQRKREQSEHQEFPDEVDVNEDEQARDRFARYRSLKSFKKTYWDPKENLPDSYSNIFTFSNFKATQRSVMQDMRDVADEAATMEGQFGFTANSNKREDVDMSRASEDDEDLLKGCVPSGSYVTITLEAVTPEAMKDLSVKSLLVAVALLPHENKVSVLHAGLSQSAGCSVEEDLPVKSKDILTFRCGWRTWKTRPVFSQNNLNCNKHKFERFMPRNGAFFAATFFGPVTYTPCPVLVFREQAEKPRELCAAGSMIGADADRIVVKRIILTGFPVRVHKRHATVKYMFYNPEDVKWFKPAGLWTKHGLNGNIIESVGEHGTLKALFNAPIKQHDTVCLPLYKRIFPKFATDAIDSDGSPNQSVRGAKPGLTVR